MKRIMIFLDDEERAALVALAQKERRHPREQAALLVRWGLEALALLTMPEAGCGAEEVGDECA